MKYPYRVYQMKVEDHSFWVAESSCLKGCVGQGETIDEATNELAENEAVWLETATECGIAIPDVPLETPIDYSGKFTVRVSPSVHRAAVELAKKEGISLNQYINDAIVSQNARLEATSFIVSEVQEAVSTIKRMIAEPVQTHSGGRSRQVMALSPINPNDYAEASFSRATLPTLKLAN